MKNAFLSLIVVVTCVIAGSAVSAEGQDSVVPATEVSFVSEENIERVEVAVLPESAIPVPEPTAFGLLVIGLAVGSGLLVRRKD